MLLLSPSRLIMLQILKKIFDFIVNLRPRTYAFCYLALIPIFALIYVLLPKHFYHNTVRYEPAYYAESEKILSEIRENIVSSFIKHYGKSTILDTAHQKSIIDYKLKYPDIGSGLDTTDYYIDINSLRLSELKIINRDIKFNIDVTEVPAQNNLRSGNMGSSLTLKFLLDDKHSISTYSEEDKEWYDFIFIRINPKSQIDLADILFPRPDLSIAANLPFIKIRRGLKNKLVNLVEAGYGFPSGIRGNAPRLLYLSAVTITTIV